MTQFNDFVVIEGEADVSEPKELYFPPNSIELPLYATEKLGVDLGSYDKYADNISNVSVVIKDGNDNVIAQSSEDEPVEKDGKGLYSFELDGSLINRGTYTAEWAWDIAKRIKNYQRTASTFYYAYFQSPDYYMLSDEERTIVRAVMARFADMYDNSLGQSRFNFFENYQSTYGVNRVAKMLDFACNAINVEMTPATNFAVGGKGKSFPRQWYSVLETATYVELLRHAVRSYVEQPSIAGGTDVPYADRRDYLQRWASVLEETKASLAAQLAAMRRDRLNLGGTAVLISGGIYGSITPSAIASLERGRIRGAYAPVIFTNR